ncbi:MAG: Bug family tripartite tricarboxylate transporter substrate binding protein [Dongiaceae bacterium]
MLNLSKYLLTCAACLPLLCMGTVANAADFPERGVEINSGAPPGGTGDLLARIVAQKLSEKWGQPAVVMNRVGANHRIAAAHVAHAKPDGYTMLVMTSDLMATPPEDVDITYDRISSFVPAALIGSAPNCLVVGASLPVGSVAELLAMAKAEPKKLNAAVYGTGGVGEVAFTRLFLLTKTPMMEFLRYTGSSKGMIAILASEAHVTIVPCSSAMQHVESGALKVLAISQKSDLPLLAVVPTFEEATGLEGYNGPGSNRYGLSVPAGTPEDIVTKIRHDVDEVLQAEDVKEKLTSQFIIPGTGQDDFAELVKSEVTRWDTWTKENKEGMAAAAVQ